MAADSATASPGGDHEKIRHLGKYQIERRLGAGGMGAVFLAHDTDLKRTVALKVLPKDRKENPTLVKRFKAEAQAVAQLQHPNVVSIFETGEIQGFPYLALEFVDGQDLQTRIEKRGPLPPKRSLKIMRQVVDALQHAYEKNIVHRDIKPSNLLVQPDGTAKITDFGLARSVDETLDTSITRAGTTVGTIDYISPEQACNSKAADIRSDIYSLGCTWYHMLTGEPPFPEGNIQNKLQGHMTAPPPN
ncbi:MAG: serine/threonine protein kinase, partial [Planctomycetaceae bacterium]|nr:serine/threonine protein kinase [Planctomycetaceae bacterium]